MHIADNARFLARVVLLQWHEVKGSSRAIDAAVVRARADLVTTPSARMGPPGPEGLKEIAPSVRAGIL